jgi:hypothetical protein
MKRLAMKFLGAMLLTALAAGFAIPARAQESEDALLAEKAEKARVAQAALMKSIVQSFAKQNGKYRAEVVLLDKSKVVGTISAIHESDFVMTDNKTKSSRTIAYADVAQGPEAKKSRAEVIMGDTAIVIFLIPLLPILLPLSLIMMATGGMD